MTVFLGRFQSFCNIPMLVSSIHPMPRTSVALDCKRTKYPNCTFGTKTRYTSTLFVLRLDLSRWSNYLADRLSHIPVYLNKCLSINYGYPDTNYEFK